VAEIVALDEVDVVVDVVEDFVGRLREGMPARVTIEAVPDRIFSGTIHRIVPSADRRGRTFPVKIRLPNPREGDAIVLKSGMFASATLAVDEPRPGLLVPKDAIVLGGMVPVMVWVVDAESSTAKMIPVQLGIAVDDKVQVLGPLQPGMQVITVGNERIMFPGQPVRVIEK
jgi:Cu(I)/Ag(I) efflux system membrane fusion protein/cobalt-zinc-cadmium efflux system membrane fusion protein